MAYRPTEKTKARKLAQHQLLLDSSISIVSCAGFKALTIAELAKKADVATGTVYKYFENKADLCTQVFRRGSEKEVELVRAAAFPASDLSGDATTTCKQRLSNAITSFAERAIAGHRLAYALIAEPVDPMVEAERLTYRSAYADVFQALIEEGISTGEFRPQDSTISAAAIVGALAETLIEPLGLDRPEDAIFDPSKLISSIEMFCLNALLC